MLLKRLFQREQKQIEIINFEKLFILMGLYITKDNKKIGVLKQVDYLGANKSHVTSFNKCIISLTEEGKKIIENI